MKGEEGYRRVTDVMYHNLRKYKYFESMYQLLNLLDPVKLSQRFKIKHEKPTNQDNSGQDAECGGILGRMFPDAYLQIPELFIVPLFLSFWKCFLCPLP